jgi:non-ribosomal peptide synthetase component F
MPSCRYNEAVGVLGHLDLGQQAGGGDAFVYNVRRHRRLYQRLALRAHPLATHMALHGEDTRLVVLLLRDVSPMRLSAQPQWQVVLCGVLHVATRQMD